MNSSIIFCSSWAGCSIFLSFSLSSSTLINLKIQNLYMLFKMQVYRGSKQWNKLFYYLFLSEYFFFNAAEHGSDGFFDYNSKISFLSGNSSLMSSLLITLSVPLGFFFLCALLYIHQCWGIWDYSSGKWRVALASKRKESQAIRWFSPYIIPKFCFNCLNLFLYLSVKTWWC